MVFDSGVVVVEFVKIKLIDELIKIVNLFFNVFELYFMWEYIVKLFLECDRLLVVSEEVNGVENWEDYKESRFVVILFMINCFEVFCLMDFILDVVILVS